jgi:hypothetical protein
VNRIRKVARVITATTLVGVTLFVCLARAPLRPMASAVDAHTVFDEVVKNEPSARGQAKEDWPQHRWSQQDAFSALERERVETVAHSHGLAPQEVYRVLDEGLRAHWSGAEGSPLTATVVPLKPRPMD